MKKSTIASLLTVTLLTTVCLAGCGQSDTVTDADTNADVVVDVVADADKVAINLSDEGITVDGRAVSTDEGEAVYIANDIVYYEEGKDFTYGKGTEADEHSRKEAAAHTVVHITQPGNYVLSGELSAGQIAVDLGEEAEENPEAVVTLILNGVDIKCSVAPAVIFYNVYECGSTQEANREVDTTAAGANVIIADGTENNVTGSYVARIYKSVELNEAGTEVVDSKKLHKYDGAFYSKMSMNVNGGEAGTGILNIKAENEGLDSELHLTINGGIIHIIAGNDGINTNEDGYSVTTINGGTLHITVDGGTGEGDGIDSNGYIVINGGTVEAYACSDSADSGLDSDMGIYLNGGTVTATGNMLDTITESKLNYAVFSFAERQSGGSVYTLKNAVNQVVAEAAPENDFQYLVISTPSLTEETYTLWKGEEQLSGSSGSADMHGGGMERPEGMEPPEGMERPEGMEPPEGMEHPAGDRGGFAEEEECTTEFVIVTGGNYFRSVTAAQTSDV